jgi:hypothetical protein
MSDFIWTFPCYLLVEQYARDPDTGDVAFDEHLRFITPAHGSAGEPCIAIFTDSDLAQRYRREVQKARKPDLLEFATPAQLKAFLERARPFYRFLVIDPKHEVLTTVRLAPIEELLPQLGE